MALLPDILPSESAIHSPEELVDPFDLAGHGCLVELSPVGAIVDDGHEVVDDRKYRMQVPGKFGEFAGSNVVIGSLAEKCGEISRQLHSQRPEHQLQFGPAMERRNGSVVVGKTHGRQQSAKTTFSKPTHGIDHCQSLRQLEYRCRQLRSGSQLVVVDSRQLPDLIWLVSRGIKRSEAFLKPNEAGEHVRALGPAALGTSKHGKPASEIGAKALADRAKLLGRPKPLSEGVEI